jgi:hypothetical protein
VRLPRDAPSLLVLQHQKTARKTLEFFFGPLALRDVADHKYRTPLLVLVVIERITCHRVPTLYRWQLCLNYDGRLPGKHRTPRHG